MNEEQVKQMLDGIAGINERLDGVDQRLEVADKRFDSLEADINRRFNESNNQLAAWFRSIERRFDEIIEIKADKAQLDRFIALLDKDLKERETDEQERLLLNEHVRRLAARVRVLETKVA